MRRSTNRVAVALVSLSLATSLLIASHHARAIDDAPAWAYALAHELMSPYCPGRTLAECPSPQATSLRFEILMQAAAGATEEEVRELLTSRYGDVLLAAPRAEGWGLSAYVIPIAFFVLGGPVVVLIIRRLTGKGEDDQPAPSPRAPSSPAADPELERQLEKELAEF